jgi:hypothetical protein
MGIINTGIDLMKILYAHPTVSSARRLRPCRHPCGDLQRVRQTSKNLRLAPTQPRYGTLFGPLASPSHAGITLDGQKDRRVRQWAIPYDV